MTPAKALPFLLVLLVLRPVPFRSKLQVYCKSSRFRRWDRDI